MVDPELAWLTRPDLPAAFERWEEHLPPGASRRSSASEWAGALVLVQSGTLAVDCEATGRAIFRARDLLALGWLPIVSLRSVGSEAVHLVAVRQRDHRPSEPHLHVTRTKGASEPMRFRTVIELGGKTATGFEVPPEVVEAFGRGKRVPVQVTIGPHTYRSTTAVMDGRYLLPLSAENREAAGVAAGDEVEVQLTLDDQPREVEVPDDLAAALDAEPAARATFDGLSNSNKRYHLLQVTGAKTDETRQRRIAKAVATLREGKPR